MIEIDRTDEEREELVKQWIKDYWLFVVGVIGLAIAMVYGLNAFRQSKINALSDTAMKVEQVSADLGGNRVESASKVVEDLQSDSKETTFSAVATLELAKKYFDSGKYQEAIQQYDWLIKNTGAASIRDIARVRKARAQANAKQYDEAVTTLAGTEGKDYLVEANLLKGDILMANNQFSEAKVVYETLQEQGSGLNPEVTQKRLDLLTIKQQKSAQ